MEDYQIRHPQERISNALIQASGKMVLIDKLLARLKESGHKVGVVQSNSAYVSPILYDYHVIPAGADLLPDGTMP